MKERDICIITGAYAFSTTTVSEFVCAMRKMKFPEGFIITCSVVIRFFPTISEDFKQIRNAMRLKGIHKNILGVLKSPFQYMEYMMIPMLMNSNNVVQDLSVASLTKGIGRKEKHTSMVEIGLRVTDYVAMLLVCIPIILVMEGRF